ncbi:MAG: protein translocase subunit SecD [Zoogloeaceae bacterium]|jgi:preprotein translocase subunit SecD|nr:protein translocase subunit SecD [Zoogloeaceae bacterium]
MNRYPLWKYATVTVALALGLLYTLPNLFGESPAVQISSAHATVKVDAALESRINAALEAEQIVHEGLLMESNGIRLRFQDGDTQARARDALERALNPDRSNQNYVVTLNLLSNSPRWLSSLGALPMYLGLDLRGGVHFLLQVDMPGAELKRLDSLSAEIRTRLRDNNLRHAGISREDRAISLQFREREIQDKARALIAKEIPDLALTETEGKLSASLTPDARVKLSEYALQQNIHTLHNRVNELGVAEPVIAQQGADRIVVQLPGVQDIAKAKDIIGRTATLEIHLVEDDPGALASASSGILPLNTELFTELFDGKEIPLLLKKQVALTGEHLTNAQPGYDDNHQPAVHLTFDSTGARIFRDLTRENVNKRMAILLIEKGKGEVVTAPRIREEISGGRVQISGRMTSAEASDIALLLRSGSLAAPMEIVEERTVGPSLGKDNIQKGFHSTLWGFLVIVLFMSVYYQVFGIISSLALSVNLLFLVALLSLLQATLTLPGIAAIALTLGMAIDANVLINERIREELRAGLTPHAAIVAGYDRAFDTILDSNLTTLIAGLALLIFGSGPVRGFAVVHCLGILTSIFSAVTVSRAFVSLCYGRQQKLLSIAIGQIWKPEADTAGGKTSVARSGLSK